MEYENNRELLRNPVVKIEAPLAMAYIPMQKFKELYPPEIAYTKGTVFKELSLPFEGREQR